MKDFLINASKDSSMIYFLEEFFRIRSRASTTRCFSKLVQKFEIHHHLLNNCSMKSSRVLLENSSWISSRYSYVYLLRIYSRDFSSKSTINCFEKSSLFQESFQFSSWIHQMDYLEILPKFLQEFPTKNPAQDISKNFFWDNYDDYDDDIRPQSARGIWICFWDSKKTTPDILL